MLDLVGRFVIRTNFDCKTWDVSVRFELQGKYQELKFAVPWSALSNLNHIVRYVGMAELADATDLKSVSEKSEGSSPSPRTKL